MRLLFLVFISLAATLAGAPAFERDLGGGLTYFRVRHVPDELPTSAPAGAPRHSSILDLRYAQGEARAANALTAWLKPRATPRTPVFVLANAETSPALLALLARRTPNDGIVLLGAASPGFAPDIAIKISPEAERIAFDAYESQADPLALLRENAAKVRNDEARLSREHVPGSGPEDTASDSSTATDKGAAVPPAPPVDYVLQRAFHLHRALVALKKI